MKCAVLTPALNDLNYSNGSASISSLNPARNLLKSYLDNYSSSNNNMKAVAYMLDTDVWNVFKTDKADYAIGGPTVEMLLESYNKKHNKNYKAKAINENGYLISKDGGINWIPSSPGLLDDSDTLYTIKDWENAQAQAMWISSPSANGSEFMMSLDANSDLGRNNYTNTCIGFRPIVCLSSGVQVEQNNDGSVTIK